MEDRSPNGPKTLHEATTLQRLALNALKVLIPIGIFSYLLWSVAPEDYRAFLNEDKRWGLIALAQVLAICAILISFFRWYVLVRAFDIAFTYREALRLGFLGYLLNFVSFGSVGGDLFKAILVAKDKPDRRPEAIASVLFDRALGLLGLLLLAWLCLSLAATETLAPTLVAIRNAAGIIAALSIAGLMVAIFAGAWFDRIVGQVQKLRVVGEPIARMALAVRLLRKRPQVLLLLGTCSIGVHALLATTVFVISKGVYEDHPTLAEHMMVVPPAMAAGTLPLAPGGIGYQEGALAGLFRLLPDLPGRFSGILVATIYRLITLTIAGIGLVIYFFSRDRELTGDTGQDD
ncbi:MAG: lysylphosphatidylglycerol synthase transmembrane domain-containing protein [Aureliella sp.]